MSIRPSETPHNKTISYPWSKETFSIGTCFERISFFICTKAHKDNRQQDQQPTKNLRRNLNLLRFYPARTQSSAVSEHANETGHLPICKEVRFIDRDPHWYTRRVKEAIHIRLHPCNINRDRGTEIPEAWIPTIKKHNSRSTTKRICKGTTSNSRNNNEDRTAPIAANQHATNSDT